MGNFLDTPITTKETEVGTDPSTGLQYGLSAMQGWRAQMEDDHVQQLSLPEFPSLSLFGVYDGHGGDMVAHYTARHFPRLFCKELKSLHSGIDVPPAQSQHAFEKALMAIDAEMRALPEVESGQDQSGSTSVMTLLSKHHIVCANTGDSRAVLCRKGEAVPLSHDHKPYNPGEKQRIEAAGSHVKFNRVNGDLAVSRALGDFVYKRCDTMKAEDQAVTAFPEIVTESRTADDEFIVLACDGIWDVMSSQDVCCKVTRMLQAGRPTPPEPEIAAEADEGGAPEPKPPPEPERPWDLGAVAECLIDHCLRLGSRDNMSVIVVLLDPKLATSLPKAEPGDADASNGAEPTAAL